jgi:hypothetical protein
VVNQHVPPTFRFSPAQFARMRAELGKRMKLLGELAPWPDLNYAIDESWAAVHPYGSRVRKGDPVALRLRIFNHSPRTETYRIAWNTPAGWRATRAEARVTIPPRREGEARAVFQTGAPGLHVVTADIEFGDRRLREWTEALVRVDD